MSTKITYLLGAGASAQVLPLVENMGNRMKEMRDRINKLIPSDDERTKIFLIELDSFIDEMKNHGSIDICMRRMFLQSKNNAEGKRKYIKHKKLLAAYLTLEQMERTDSFIDRPDIYKPGIDKRYDSFFANFLDSKTEKFPPDFRILTWNYDFQFICAGGKYIEKDYIDVRNKLSIVANKKDAKSDYDGNKIIYLNGIIEKTPPPDRNAWDSASLIDSLKINLNLDTISVLNIVDSYNNWTTDNKWTSDGTITFSWDSDNTIRDFAKDETNGTNILVIVGYSFPFFNRAIDKEILNNMKFLQNIYIQGKDLEDSKKIKNKFVKIFDKSPSIVEEVEGDEKEFFVPPSIDFAI